MLQLPRSRTVWLLRTPAPFRSLAAFLFLVAVTAAVLNHMPALVDRVQLSEPLTHASVMRIDPVVEHADRGRWPARRTASEPGSIPELSWNHTAQGIELIHSRAAKRVRLNLDFVHSPGDTLVWRCRVRADDADTPLSPLSVPAVCSP
jgi:hypothetical protein